ncbi:MAG: hypothetical protein Q9191_001392 [Dirinaria sp. TL-2023a]
MTDELDYTQQIFAQITDINSQLEAAQLDREAEKRLEKHVKLMEWLSPVDAQEARDRILEARTPGTGQWLTTRKAFQQWRDSVESATFWLNGMTGAGKSTLMTTVLGELSGHISEHHIAYYYSSFTNSESLSARNVLGSLLAQLVSSDTETGYIETLYTKHVERNFRLAEAKQGASEDLYDAVATVLRSREQVYILLDGVNECEDPETILNSMLQLVQNSPATAVHLFVSSINEKGIETCIDMFPRLSKINLSSLRGQELQQDIHMLISSSLESDARLRRHSPQLKAEIESTLTKGAKGMFRWVQCQLDILSRLRTPAAVKRALRSLPPTLDQTYQQMLDRIDGEEDRKLARDILEILTFTYKPLRLELICELLQITPGKPSLDEDKSLADPRDVLSICGNLLTYESETKLVALAHQSVQTFLSSSTRAGFFHFSEHEFHRTMAMKCLTYLSFDEFATGLRPRKLAVRLHHMQYPLLSYASQCWTLHLRDAHYIDDELWLTVRDFLRSADRGRHNFHSWVQILIPYSEPAQIYSTPPIYYMASYGLLDVVQYLVAAGADFEALGGRNSATPLNVASVRGHYDVVHFLFKRGANPFSMDALGKTPIQWARRYGFKDIFDLLTYNEGTTATDMVVEKVVFEESWDIDIGSRKIWWMLMGAGMQSVSDDLAARAIYRQATRYLKGDEDFNIQDCVQAVETEASHGDGVFAEIFVPQLRRNYKVAIGSGVFLHERGVAFTPVVETDLRKRVTPARVLTDDEPTLVVNIAIDGKYAGMLSLCNAKLPDPPSSPVMAHKMP